MQTKNVMSLMVGGVAVGVLMGVAMAASSPTSPPPASALRQMFETYHKMPDTQGSGPYPAIKEQSPAFPDHVIYHPRDLAHWKGRTLPILLWGNGGCTDDGGSERLFLEQIASYGYLVIAPGSILSGPGIATPPPASTPTPQAALAVRTTTEQVQRGLDQALAANAAAGSWHDVLDATRIAVGGYSCGGLQALQIAADPRIRAVVITHSGIFKDGGSPIRGMRIEKSALQKLHTPVLYLLGGKSDIAYPNGTDDFALIGQVPVFMASHDVGHGGTFMKPEGGEEALIVKAWLNWQLRGDAKDAQEFNGPHCGLCQQPQWTVSQKGF